MSILPGDSSSSFLTSLFVVSTSLVSSEVVFGSPTSWLRSSLIKFESSEHSEIRVIVDSSSSGAEVGDVDFVPSTVNLDSTVADVIELEWSCSVLAWDTSIDGLVSVDWIVYIVFVMSSVLSAVAGTISDSHPI